LKNPVQGNLMVEGILGRLITEFIGEMDLSLGFAIVGLVLIVGEAFVPGAGFVVLGAGVLAAGVTGLIFELNSLLPLTVLTAVYGAIAFAGFKKIDVFGERGEQTSGADSLRGDIGVVKETVTADDGRVKLKSGGFDPFYLARSNSGEPIPEGTTVRVVNPRGGNVLEVEPIPEDGANVDDAPEMTEEEEREGKGESEEAPPDK